MHRKVFIAINLPSDTKKQLARKVEKWSHLPVYWTLNENLHITLLFLGYLEDASLPKVCEAVKRAASQKNEFEIVLNRLIVAPNKNRPRMIWAVGEKDKNLRELTLEIENQLAIKASNNEKGFRPHVTLGRIRGNKWRQLPNPPEINENIKMVVAVSQIEIMESLIEEGRRKYLALETCQLS